MSEEEALAEAIRRSLGQAPDVAHSSSSTTTAPGRTEQIDEVKREQTIKSFCEITGCESDLAVYCLNEHQWNLDTALNEYLEYKKVKGSAGTRGGNKDVHPHQGNPRDEQASEQSLLMNFDERTSGNGTTSDVLDLLDSKPPPPTSMPDVSYAPLPSASSSHMPHAPSNKQSSETSATVKELPNGEEGGWKGLDHFLAQLGLEKYASILREQELTEPEALRYVTDEDLKEMQISTIGARRKLLAAIAQLHEQAAPNGTSAKFPGGSESLLE